MFECCIQGYCYSIQIKSESNMCVLTLSEMPVVCCLFYHITFEFWYLAC